MNQVSGARFQPPTEGLNLVCPFTSVVSNNIGALPFWFKLACLKCPSKDKLSFTESPQFDVFLHKTRSSTLVFVHLHRCPLSSLFELIQSVGDLGWVSCAKGIEPRLYGNQCFSPKCKGIRGLPSRLFWSCTIGP